MKPAPFEYHAPTTVGETVNLLAELSNEAKLIAGGQSLVPILNLRLTRFDALVDLRHVAGLQSISRTDGAITVGAMVRQRDVETDEAVAEGVPLLAAATPLIGHFQIRNRGTVGGSLAHADPAAEYPAVAVALDADLDIAGPGRTRSVPAAEFFTGTWMTVLEPEEVLVGIRFPVWDPGSGFAVEEVARRHGDFAIAGTMCAVQVRAGRIERAAIALFGVDSVPVRAVEAERAAVACAPNDLDVTEVGHIAAATIEPPEDLHASGELRRRISAAVVSRAFGRALEEADRG